MPEMSRPRSPQRPHPVAGATGEGPPVAPLHWRWRCGQRVNDMYFYTPAGELIRSKVRLAAVLDTIPNSPSPSDFCWKVTPEILKSGAWNKEEERSRKPYSPRRRKTKDTTSGEANSAVPSVRMHSPTGFHHDHILEVRPLAMRSPDTNVSMAVSTPTARPKMKAQRKRSRSDPTEGPPTFREILGENSSFKWLRDVSTMEAFLREAKQLDGLSAEDVRNLRDVLVARNLQAANLVNYTNRVLRVFARILGVEGLGAEPPASLGKVDLAIFCVKLAQTPSATSDISSVLDDQGWRHP